MTQRRDAVEHEQLRLGREFHPDATFTGLGWLLQERCRREGLGRDPSEVSLHRSDDLGRIQITHQHGQGVVGGVMGAEELHRLGAGEILQLARPAQHGMAVGQGDEGGGQRGLHQLTPRARVHALPPLLLDDLPLGVELAEHRVPHPVRFQERPEFQPGVGQAHEILSALPGRGGIQPDPAVPPVDLPQLVPHDERLGLRLQLGNLFLQGRHGRRVHPPAGQARRGLLDL